MKRLTAVCTALTLVLGALVHTGAAAASGPELDPTAPASTAGVDIGRAITWGADRRPPAEASDGQAIEVAIDWQASNRHRAPGRPTPATLSVYVVAPASGPLRAGQVLPMRHIGAIRLAADTRRFRVDRPALDAVIDAALAPAQRARFRHGRDGYEVRLMASTDHAIGTLALGAAPDDGAAIGDRVSPGLQPRLVMVADGGGVSGPGPGQRSHDPARTICSSAFGSAFWPAGLQVRDTFTSDDRAELTYVKTSPTSIARLEYSASDRTSVGVGIALWGVNLDSASSKTVARELTHTYRTSAGPNQHRAITTTLYARQFLLRCMIPNPFGAVVELTRPHQYAEYHPEATEGLVPRGQTPHRWLFSCRNQFKTRIGNRNTGGSWSQHRSVDIAYENAVRLRPGGVRTVLALDVRQRIGRSDALTITYEKVHRGQLSVCGFAFKIPSQSSRVRAQGACNPKPCARVRF